jgi:hypothetical protein
VIQQITLVTYTDAEETAAATEVSTMIADKKQEEEEAAAAAVAAGLPPPPPPPIAVVKSSAEFPVAMADIQEGSPARAEFENGFKAAFAAEIGGGGVFTADEIVIDGIVSARRRRRLQAGSGVEVEWHVDAPAEVMTQVANLVNNIAETSTAITISVGGSAIVASAIAPPTVFTVRS